MSYTDYLSLLSPDARQTLFSNHHTTHALFRMFDPLAEQIILRMMLSKPNEQKDRIDVVMRKTVFGDNPIVETTIQNLIKIGILIEGTEEKKASTPSTSPQKNKQTQLNKEVELNLQKGGKTVKLTGKKRKTPTTHKKIINIIDDEDDEILSPPPTSNSTSASTTTSTSSYLSIHPAFKRSLWKVLDINNKSPSSHSTTESSKTLSSQLKSSSIMNVLKRFHHSKWDNILSYILQFTPGSIISKRKSPTLSTTKISLHNILTNSGLLIDDENSDTIISKTGYDFLLMNTGYQIWTLLHSYIELLEGSMEEQKLYITSLLLRLSFHVVGKAYEINELNEDEYSLMTDLSNFGIVYISDNENAEQDHENNPNTKFYYTTPLATKLFEGTNKNKSKLKKDRVKHNNRTQNTNINGKTRDDDEDELDKGFIIIENNYHIYAYTSQLVKRQLLLLFSVPQMIDPQNRSLMMTSVVTRNSITNALVKYHLTANQIVSFLQRNFHPHMKRVPNDVISAVTEQIKLWEKELDRISFTRGGVLYDDFEDDEMYEKVVKYAEELGKL
eukprot:TRINITY_DN4388_c0_g1_i3.p1 TRINITY_DN4388_c0_g1~~TRINITY_DN4388_c0_g1_i3.p1  ORF type:complete len:557 (+),score=83.15 TRINITY_DN4388_c0_g1_i3:12-1682(+)